MVHIKIISLIKQIHCYCKQKGLNMADHFNQMVEMVTLDLRYFRNEYQNV